MKGLTVAEIKALPAGSGNLFATTDRWPISDDRSTIDTADVGIINIDAGIVSVFGRVEKSVYFTSFSLDIPEGTKSGTHSLGPLGIKGAYYVDDAGSEELYRIESGTLTLTSDATPTRCVASHFECTVRMGSAGKTHRITAGNFDIAS